MIRLIIADDHEVVQRGLELLCRADREIEVVGLARNSSEVIDLAYQLQPHLILLDLKMPGIGGAATIRSIKRVARHTAVLILTGVVNDAEIVAATSWGIDGYILKDASPDELMQAIRIVAGGLAYLQPVVAKRMLRELATRAGIGADTESIAPIPLTARELEVLRLMATNRTNHEIAAAMTVTDETIRSHIKRILAKLQQPNRTQAVLSALRQGLISLDT